MPPPPPAATHPPPAVFFEPPTFPCQADDPELEAIRQRRMAQMMAQQGGGSGGPGGKAPASAEEMEVQAEQREAAEEQRRAMLMNIMQTQARDRRASAVSATRDAAGTCPPAHQAACLPAFLPFFLVRMPARRHSLPNGSQHAPTVPNAGPSLLYSPPQWHASAW